MASQEDIDICLQINLYGQLFIYFCGVIAHLLLLFAFVKDPLKCFKNIRTCFVINLAIADFLYCLVTPIRIYIQLGWYLDFVILSLGNLALLTVLSIAFDRLLMIVYPLKHRYWITGKMIATWLTCLWLVSFAYTSKRYIFGVEQNYEDLVYGSLTTALLLITSTAYASVYIALKEQSRNITEQNESVTNGNRAEQLRLLKEKRFLKTIVFIAGMTVAGFVPSWILEIALINNILPGDSLVWIILYFTIFSLVRATEFAINPFIYILRFPNYRKTFQILYCRRQF
jgi:hypothetical protein